MNLNWGGGGQDILLDLATGAIYQYANKESAAAVHAAFGGRNYYISLSGLSGAGYVPDRLGLIIVPGYRVDTSTGPWVEMPQAQIAGWGISVPFSYGSADVYAVLGSWPIVARNQGWDGPILLESYGVLAAVRGQLTELTERSLTARFVKRPGAEPEEVQMKFWTIEPKARWANLRRLLEALNKEILAFEWGDQYPNSNPFWGRLGLHPLSDGRVYKVTFGICRASYTREQIGTVEGLQAAAPKNVRVLAPNVYIQGQFGSRFQAVGLFAIDGEEIEYEIDLYLYDEARVVRALGGDFAEIVAELEAGAQEKHRQDMANRQWQADREREEAKQYASLAELAMANGEVMVTFADSRAAGNCDPGTRNFRDRVFPGRDEVELAALVPYLGNYNVRRVVEYKLRQLEVKN